MTLSSIESCFLYQDDALIVLEKPAGIHSVMQADSDKPSIAEELITLYPEMKTVSPNEHDGGLVHRLDMGTSGLLLAAKEPQVWQDLHRQFQKREVKKKYIALIEGLFSEKDKTVTSIIGSPYRRSKKVRIYRSSEENPRSQQAESTFTTLYASPDERFTVIEVELHTGVRHQIRAQAASLGHPLCGDELYGSTMALSEVLPCTREFFLHAHELRFVHPKEGEEKSFVSLPEELAYWDLGEDLFTE